VTAPALDNRCICIAHPKARGTVSTAIVLPANSDCPCLGYLGKCSKYNTVLPLIAVLA